METKKANELLTNVIKERGFVWALTVMQGIARERAETKPDGEWLDFSREIGKLRDEMIEAAQAGSI